MSHYGNAWSRFFREAGGERILGGYQLDLAQKAFGAGYTAGLCFHDGGMPEGARKTQCQSCGWTFGTHAPDCSAPRT